MSKIKIHLHGRHANRTPLSYSEYRTFFSIYFDFTSNIFEADVVITGFSIDINGLIEKYGSYLEKNPRIKVLVISEEPLWDLMSPNHPTERYATITYKDVSLSFATANFFNSNIFKFDKLPYFITTESKYAARYAFEIKKHLVNFNDQILKQDWTEKNKKISFLQQKRQSEVQYHKEFGEIALSSYRTNLAVLLDESVAEKKGLGWKDGVARQQLPDWHLDKLLTNRGKYPLFSAFENTHVDNYITEKIFDVFMLGSFPLYYAGPSHRVFEFVDEESVLNFYKVNELEAAGVIAQWTPEFVNMEAYYSTLTRLADLFSHPEILHEERRRVALKVANFILSECN